MTCHWSRISATVLWQADFSNFESPNKGIRDQYSVWLVVLISNYDHGMGWRVSVERYPSVLTGFPNTCWLRLKRRQHKTRHNTTRHDKTRHDTTRHDTARHGTTQHCIDAVRRGTHCPVKPNISQPRTVLYFIGGIAMILFFFSIKPICTLYFIYRWSLINWILNEILHQLCLHLHGIRTMRDETRNTMNIIETSSYRFLHINYFL